MAAETGNWHEKRDELATKLGSFRIVMFALTLVGLIFVQGFAIQVFKMEKVLGLYKPGYWEDFWIHCGFVGGAVVLLMLIEAAAERPSVMKKRIREAKEEEENVEDVSRRTYTGIVANVAWCYVIFLLIFRSPILR